MTRPTSPPPFPLLPRSAETDASIALANETAFDTLVRWMAEYIPTWGTSIALHAAAVLLAMFVVWQNVPPPIFGEYVATPVPKRPPPTVEPRDTRTPRDTLPASYGKMKPRESSFVFLPIEAPIPGIADADTRTKIVPIGIGGGPKVGSLEGLKREGGLFPPLDDRRDGGGPVNVVYVVDRSGSMTDSFEIVKLELRRSIGELDEEAQFHVIFYSGGPGVEMPTRRLVHATDRNKDLAFEFIDAVVAAGGTDPSQALDRAFASRPNLIYLLTDGEFDRAVVDQVKRRNADGKVKVYTIGFLYRRDDPVLIDIARQNGGQYKFISEEALAEIIGG